MHPNTGFDLLAGAEVHETLHMDAPTAHDFVAVTGHGFDQLDLGHAPPLLCVRALPLIGGALTARLEDEIAPGFAIQHVAQEIIFESPIPIDSAVDVVGRVAEVGDCGTRQGMRIVSELAVGGISAVKMKTTVTGGPALGQERLAIDVRGLRPGEELAQVSTEISPDLPRRYAQVSGDDNPLHLDDAFARNAGFPGVIVQGMATIALAVAAATRSCSAIAGREVRGLNARMSRPVVPGSTIDTRVFSTQTEGAFRLGVASGGAEVLKNVALWVQ